MLVVLSSAKRIRKQTGVLPYRYNGNELEVLLIQSSHAGNWTVPKGKKEKEYSKKESAAKEAMEEAGVSGKVGENLGSFVYVKGSTGVKQELIVYAMRVTKQHTNYLESDERVRQWFPFKTAAKLLPKKFGPILATFKKKVR